MDEPVEHKQKPALKPEPDAEESRSKETSSRTCARARQAASSQGEDADISAVADLGYN